MIRLMEKTFYNEKETKRKLCDFIEKADRLSMSNECEKFEKSFSEYQGREYAVLFNSGSSANLALIQALLNLKRLKRGDKIGFSALTWATNVMPLVQLGLNPVPIDISLNNLNVNSENLLGVLENKINLKSLFITNLLGFCGDLDRIKEICEDRSLEKIILLEDNCQSLGSIYKNKKLGNFGLASSSSFFVGHHLSTVEGGMVCTDDKSLYEMLSMVRAHGWGRSLDSKNRKELQKKNNIEDFYENYTFYTLGYNLRPTEVTGFLGNEQLKYIEEICQKRESNFKKYSLVTNKNSDFIKLDFSEMDFISNFAYPVICKDKKTFKRYIEKFSDIAEVRPIVGGSMTKQPFFKDVDFNAEIYCPNAGLIHEQGFYIPNNPHLKEEEVETMCNILGLEKYIGGKK